MPKRRQTSRPSTQNHLLDHIKIKIEKDCDEEESLVIQNFQPASSFDEANKIKREVEISYDLVVEDVEKSNDENQRDIEDGPTSDDEVESSSGSRKGLNPKSGHELTENGVNVKLEAEDYSGSQKHQHHQPIEVSNNSEAIKEEIEDFGIDFVSIEVNITKVDMEIAEPYAKKLKLDQAKSTSRKSTSGKKSAGETTSKTRRSIENAEKEGKGSIDSKKASTSSKIGVVKAPLRDEGHEDSEESSRDFNCTDNEGQSTLSHDSEPNTFQTANKRGKSLKASTKSRNMEPESSKSPAKSKSMPQSTSKSRKADNSDSNSSKSRKAESEARKNSTADNNKQNDRKYFDIFTQCKSQSQKGAKPASDPQNSKSSSESAPATSKPVKPSRSSRKSLTKALKSVDDSSNTKNPQESNSNELCSRLSIEDTKDPRLAALFKKVSVKKEQGIEAVSKSSQIDSKSSDIKKLHEMHLDALGLGVDSPSADSESFKVPSASRKSQQASISSPKKEFQCKLCPRSFDKRVGLFNHQAFHTSYDYPCLKCGMKFKTLRAFKKHECPICMYCGKKFKNKPKLIRHVTYVHSQESKLELFSCDICGKAVKYKVSIERHMREHLEVTKNLRFKCEICNKSFKKRMGMQNHQILHVFATLSCSKCGVMFKKQKPFEQHKCLTCTHCPKNFSSKTKLNDHIRNIHTDVSELDLFICDFCGKGFKYRPSLIRHVMDHREEAKYKCEVCGKKWKSDIALRDHIRVCHAAELTTCKICLKQMKPQCIYQHMRYVHSTVRDFTCKICDAAFKTKEKLKRHLDTHNRKFSCSQCDRKFSSQYELTEHLKWHEDPHAYQCSICKKSFSTRTSLNTHSKLHKGIVRNLKCPHCPFITHRKESIKYHLTTHEKRDKKLEMKKNWLKCDKCGALLKNKASLWGHHRKVHHTERFTCDICGVIIKTKYSMKHHITAKHLGQ